MSTESDFQAAFVKSARERMEDPMVTDGPRTESTLDNPDVIKASDIPKYNIVEAGYGDGDDDSDEYNTQDDTIARIDNLDTLMRDVIAGNAKTHEAITTIVELVEKISTQVEPMIQKITESKWFRMFI